MSLPLADFRGEQIYLDTNILVGLVDADSVYHSACEAFFQRTLDPARPIQLVTCTLTLDEVVFVLLQELVAKPPYNVLRSRSQYLQNHPDVVKALMAQLAPLVDALFDLITFEPVIPADIRQMRQEMSATGILPRDAIHLAVMKRLELIAIASDDEGFDHYQHQGITLFLP
ncbi:MAG: type II toxin-antitoxin system VapC family toxin [Deltaproteobacteria bacterium]|nr:type II toxin-antitoxin system VapC family toxin [Deltaproteobacteria bacterium]